MADGPDHEQLPQDFYTRKHLQGSAIGIYQNMLNRHIMLNRLSLTKSTFIFDPDLTESIRVVYAKKTSRITRLDLHAEIHRRTRGILLTSYLGGLLFTVNSEVNRISSFDLILVTVDKREINGRDTSYLTAIKAFM